MSQSTAAVPGREHAIDPTVIHHEWDNRLAPALTIRSGDTVHFDCQPTGERQIFRDSDVRVHEVEADFDTIYNLSGPVHVEGAEPGDTLRVDVLSLTPADWGWTWIWPDLGLLPEDFPDPYVKVFDLTKGATTTLVPGVEIPIRPFLGVMGNAPDEPAVASPFPPFAGGGNLDNRHLTVGSSVWLPVLRPGALFSTGDAHAAQGDGEVCVTGLECGMKASLRFTLEKRSISVPQYRTVGGADPAATVDHHGTMGIDGDLMQGARKAVRGMIDWLEAEHGLSRQDAYVLCSLAGDLKILEVVDLGVWNVSMAMPLSVFV